MGSKRVNWDARRAEISAAALKLFRESPREEVTLAAVAERVGLNYWQVARVFGTPEDLYRGAADLLIDRVADSIGKAPAAKPSVAETIKAYVTHAVEVMNTEAYRSLIYFCVRDACAHSWLANAYQRRIAEPLKGGLENAVSEASMLSGTLVGVRRGAADRFLARLEAMIVAPKLLPSGSARIADERGTNLSPIVVELIGSTFALEPGAEAA